MSTVAKDTLRRTFNAMFAPGHCRSCGEEIWWCTTKNGKAAPLSLGGVNHFADCPKAKEHRK